MGRTAGGSSSLYNRLMEYIASGRGGGNERGQLTDSSLSVSLHPSRELKTAVSQAERQCGNSYSQPETREMGEDRVLDGEK